MKFIKFTPCFIKLFLLYERKGKFMTSASDFYDALNFQTFYKHAAYTFQVDKI